jgi:hypothetical protein
MAKVISLQKTKERRVEKGEAGDLTGLLRRATLICKENLNFSQDKLSVIKEGQLKNVLEGKITQEIFSRKLISSDIFLCGIYVAKLLSELALSAPESWWAVDYFASDDLLALKRGGDSCFIICGVFPERGNRRMMKIAYYQKMGVSFYYKFYNRANIEIGYHMSNQFQTMVAIVQSCIKNF